ncbi:hypothetical protein [Paeniglutamicibacter terrestris]|uniref:Uncharacterized protein n=1 Tax=Paeniglutamicibacter terrestris TaxID=2723403 RepID=A0ABX1G850_9MICC|nr:hypothetical protein [Paeniglutamicibacter terrestris]NKG22219.1 hypothetical protein [Paeniglutamicibacter terrestris]
MTEAELNAARDEKERLKQEACAHEHFRKEIYMGQRSGDYECSSCGLVISKSKFEARKANI